MENINGCKIGVQFNCSGSLKCKHRKPYNITMTIGCKYQLLGLCRNTTAMIESLDEYLIQYEKENQNDVKN